MAYSTGTGTGTDFLDAIIAHAVADGWVEDGGVGTGFPLVKGGLYVHMGSFTVNVDDWTNALSFTNRTVTIGDMGIGVSAAEANTNRTNATNRVKLFEFSYGISEWHIFSDATGDYINWAFRFANPHWPEIWSHGGFGFIDKEGLSHGGIGFATSSDIPTYVPANNSAIRDYSAASFGWPWGQSKFRLEFVSGTNVARRASTQFVLFAPGVTPAATTFPQPGTVFFLGERLTQAMNPGAAGTGQGGLGLASLTTNSSTQMTWIGAGANNNPFTGTLTLAPANVVLLPSNSDDSSLNGIFAGTFPGVRACNVQNISSGGEVDFVSDTWKIFPLFRRTDISRLANQDREFTSGRYGIAHKKVV